MVSFGLLGSLNSSAYCLVEFLDGASDRTTEVLVIQRISVHRKHLLVQLNGVSIHPDGLGLTILGTPGQQRLNPSEVLPVNSPSEFDRKSLGQVSSLESGSLDIGQIVGERFMAKVGSVQQLFGDQIVFLTVQVVE